MDAEQDRVRGVMLMERIPRASIDDRLGYLTQGALSLGFIAHNKEKPHRSARAWLFDDHSIIGMKKLDSVFSHGGRGPIKLRPGMGIPERS